MKILTKKSIISLLIALIMIFNLMPFGIISKVYADGPQDITKIEINNFNLELSNAITGNVARNLIKASYTYPDGANYGRGNDNTWIMQNGSLVYGNKLVAGAETYVMIEVYANPYGLNRDNPDYDFDEENLSNIEIWINGSKSTEAYISGYNESWRCVDVYIPVTVTEYEGTKYTVTYDSNGGSLVESEDVPDQSYADKPLNPTKEGQVFTGWYTDEELSAKFDFNTKITEDITLYAGWEDKIEAQHITKIEINNFNPELSDGITGNQAMSLIKGMYTYPDGANYGRGNDNTWIMQNDSYVYGDKLVAGAETYVNIEVYAKPYGLNHDNPNYDFDGENLSDIEIWINGSKSTDAYATNYNEGWRSVDVFIPITVEHTLAQVPAKAATCTETGNNAYYKCNDCNKLFKDAEGTQETTIEAETIAKLVHTPKEETTRKITKATLTKDGSIIESTVLKCSKCGEKLGAGGSFTAIFHPKTIKLSTTSYTYDGKVKKPTVVVKDSEGYTINSSNYTVTYASGRKNVGKYKVVVKFKGNYSGTKTLYFTIKPKTTSISKLMKKTKGFTVKLKKQATQTTGYQIQYATNSKFTSNVKTVTVSSNKTITKTISKLKANKKYYVRVRTYKTVSGTKYCSAWSSAKTVTTKK